MTPHSKDCVLPSDLVRPTSLVHENSPKSEAPYPVVFRSPHRPLRAAQMAADSYCSQVTWSGTKKEMAVAMKWPGSRQRIRFGMLDVTSPPSLWWIVVSMLGLALVVSDTSV